MVKPLQEGPRDFRLFSRAQIQLPVHVQLNESSPPEVVHGFSNDLSVGGMGAVIRADLSGGWNERVMVSIKKGRELLSVQARIRYQNGVRYGFEFINVTAANQETIRRLITKRRVHKAAAAR